MSGIDMDARQKSRTFYTKANGAIKCKEVEDGYACITSYGHYQLTTYFAGLDDIAEYIYYTAADEGETLSSIKRDIERSFRSHEEV